MTSSVASFISAGVSRRGRALREIDPDFLHRGGDHRMNRVCRLRAGGHGTRVRRIRQLVEKRRRHLRAAGVVHAGKNHRRAHFDPQHAESQQARAGFCARMNALAKLTSTAEGTELAEDGVCSPWSAISAVIVPLS